MPRERLGRAQRRDDGVVTRAVSQPGGPSILAAAQVLTKGRISQGGKRGKARVVRDPSGWQGEAWALLDEIGELWFAGAWMSSAVSRVRLVAAKTASSDEPHVLEGDRPPGSQPLPDGADDGQDENDRMVAELVARWAGGPSGQEQFLSRAGFHLAIAGDSYFVARQQPLVDAAGDTTAGDPAFDLSDDGSPGEDWVWMAYSDSEIQVPSDGARRGGWQVDEGDGSRPLGPDALVIRCWRPHPRRFREAASAVRAALPILRELRGLTMHVSAQVDSRLAGAGLLILPQSMTFPSGDQNADANDGEDPFVQALMEAMVTPIKDRDSAAAVVPIVIKVPDESVGKAQHIRFDTPLDQTAKALREEAIQRLSLALDIPPEIVTGLGDTNHWSAWQIDESAIKLHVAPIASLICHALTIGWLHPLLEEMGVPNARDYLVWFDTQPLVLRPDRSKDAAELYDRAAIGGKALRRETGFTEADAPSKEERDQQLLVRIVERAPTLAPLVLPLLGIDLPRAALADAERVALVVQGLGGARDAGRLSQEERAQIGRAQGGGGDATGTAAQRGRPESKAQPRPGQREGRVVASAGPADAWRMQFLEVLDGMPDEAFDAVMGGLLETAAERAARRVGLEQ